MLPKAEGCGTGTHAAPLHIPMWSLNDPTAMAAAPSLYHSLKILQRKTSPPLVFLRLIFTLYASASSGLSVVKFRRLYLAPKAVSLS
ncbi:hypothetical protein GOODEAATRI_007683 [Goodea atripinnis]|uniref:Uncharacterized protein n=1 Tax=Goodea atripinnis TaxID=208336 RepID=A0ABV0NIA9_9TELE